MTDTSITLVIDIGGTKLTAAVFEGNCIMDREVRFRSSGDGRQWALDNIASIVSAWQDRHRFERCGISFGGPVDFRGQRIYQSTHVGGWSDIDLVGWIRTRFGISAVIDNDANAGALGEAMHGAGRGADPFFFLTLSTGVGGGIVLNGKLLRGADGFAGEMGHIPVMAEGPECLCGAKGCLERSCGGMWLERDHGLPALELMRDPEFVSRYVVGLARGLKTVIMLLNPARIAVGGGIAKSGDALFVPLRRELHRQIPAWSRARIEVVPAEHPDDCTLYGAYELARQGRDGA
jgi:glucokinase